MIATHMVSVPSSGAGQPPSRGRSNRVPPLSGLLLIDKPQGVTSFDVVAAVRGTLHMKKVGHAGTLDPMATGALVVGFGDATRLLPYIVEHDKTYEATIRLGRSTTTDDADGELIDAPLTVVPPANVSLNDAPLNECGDAWRQLAARLGAPGGLTIDMDSVTEEWRQLVESMIAGRLTGRIEQVPNTFSAIKINGRRAYDLARAGGDVELKARPVVIHEFSVLDLRIGFVDRSRTNGPLLDYADAGCAADGCSVADDGCLADVRSASRGSSGADSVGAGFIGVNVDEVNIDVAGIVDAGIGSVGSSARTESRERTDLVPAIDVKVRVACSAGTYIRALARDLGAMLGCGGYLTRLRRTRVGRFALPDYRVATDAGDAVADSGHVPLRAVAERDETDARDDADVIGMSVIHAHVEPKTFVNRDGETVTRLKCVLDMPSDKSAISTCGVTSGSSAGIVGDAAAGSAGKRVGDRVGDSVGSRNDDRVDDRASDPLGNRADEGSDGRAADHAAGTDSGSGDGVAFDRAVWLRSQALHMADAARGAMPCLNITIDEARLLRFGQRIERSGLRKDTAYAAIAPFVCDASHSGDDGDGDGELGDLVAIVERANAHQIKPVTVFTAAQ